MMVDRRRGFLIGAAIVFAVLLVAGVATASLGSSHPRSHKPAASEIARSGLSTKQASMWTPVPPLTDVPAETPVQEQYDSALASGLSSSSSVEAAEAAQVPSPGFSAAWPGLPASNTPEEWVRHFSQELLDIDFAHQSRTGLGEWLSSEEAPELLAGVPAAIADKVLYLSLCEATAVGGTAGPIPDASTWQADAQTGQTWNVSNLVIQPDPQFSQIVASGWQPIDQRFAVEDVTGTITATQRGSSVAKSFSMAVYVGSAHWHEGYGTVLVNDWKET